MASGSFNKEFTNYSTKYKLIVDWSSAATVSTNSSVVTCVIKLYCPYGLNIAARTGNIITINGTNYTYNSPAINTDGGTTHTLATVKSNAIKHNADGSKSVTITCNFNFNATLGVTKYGTITASKTVALDKIAQKAIITAAPNFNDEQNPTITYSNGAGNAVTSLRACISFTGATDDIAYRAISKTGTSYTFNLTDAERAVLRNATTTANSRTVKFYIETVINGETYRHNISKTLSIVNAAPKLSPVAKDVGSISTTLTGNADVIIKNYNVISVSSSAVAQKGATIVSEKISCGSKSINSGSGSLYYVDSGDIVFSATDSRGNTTTQTLKKTLINYVDLTCNLAAGAPTADGKMNFTISGNCFNGSFGAQNNAVQVQYRYKKDSNAYGNWTAATATFSGNTYNAAVALTGLDYQSTYTFQARVIDSITNKESAERKVKTVPIFDWGADDFKFNVPVSYLDKKLFYTAGDTVTMTDAQICFSGFVSNGQKQLYITIPISKPIFATGVSFNGTVLCRSLNGYINGTTYSADTAIDLSGKAQGYTIRKYLNEAGITLIIDFTSAITNVTVNNAPISATPYGTLTITFS